MDETTNPSVYEQETYYLGGVEIDPMMRRIKAPGYDPEQLTLRQINALALLATPAAAQRCHRGATPYWSPANGRAPW